MTYPQEYTPKSGSSWMTVFYITITEPDDAIKLEEDLTKINDWCSVWLMQLYQSKCRLVNLTKKKYFYTRAYTLHGHALDTMTSFKYLGVYLTPNLLWNHHVDIIIAEASCALSYIKRNLKSTPPDLCKLPYETYVSPKMEYVSAIWSPHQLYLINFI